MRGKTRFDGNYMRGALGATRGSSARGRRRRCLSGGCTPFQRTVGLDMTRGSSEAGGTFVQEAVDVDVSKFPALEAGFVVSRVVSGKGGIMVAACPPYFGVFEGDFFCSGQGGGQGGGGRVLRSSCGFFNEILVGSQLFQVSVEVRNEVSHA